MKKSLFADFSLLSIAFIWGITFVLVQNAIGFLEPFTFNGIRFIVAALLLTFWLLIFKRDQFFEINSKILLSGFFLGVWLFLGYAFQTIGLLYTTSSKAGFLTGLSVVLVPVFSMLFLKQFLGLNAICGVLIATIGLFLLTLGDLSGVNIGDGFMFICAIAFAMHIIFTGKYSGQFPALLLTVIQIFTVAMLSILCSFIFEDFEKVISMDIMLSNEVFIALFITAVFATAIAFFAQTNFQKYTTATRVALIFAMEPVFAALTGYFWAQERLSYSALIGCLLIFFGMILAELPNGKYSLFIKRKKSLES